MNNPRIADSFPARVRFLTPEEGGRRPLGNPAVSQLAVPPFQTSCLVVAVDQEDEPLAADTVIPLGEGIAARVVVWGANYCARELGSLGPASSSSRVLDMWAPGGCWRLVTWSRLRTTSRRS